MIRDSADDVIGFVHVRDILAPDLADRSIRVGDLAREITSFPGSKEVLSTLTEMRRLRQHLAIVAGRVRRHGRHRHDGGPRRGADRRHPGRVRRRSDRRSGDEAFGVTTVDGLLNLEDFEDETSIELPEGPYETVAGFVIARLGRVPLLGDVVIEADHSFEVVELDGRRVSRVKVTRGREAVRTTTGRRRLGRCDTMTP